MIRKSLSVLFLSLLVISIPEYGQAFESIQTLQVKLANNPIAFIELMHKAPVELSAYVGIFELAKVSESEKNPVIVIIPGNTGLGDAGCAC